MGATRPMYSFQQATTLCSGRHSLLCAELHTAALNSSGSRITDTMPSPSQSTDTSDLHAGARLSVYQRSGVVRSGRSQDRLARCRDFIRLGYGARRSR